MSSKLAVGLLMLSLSMGFACTDNSGNPPAGGNPTNKDSGADSAGNDVAPDEAADVATDTGADVATDTSADTAVDAGADSTPSDGDAASDGDASATDVGVDTTDVGNSNGLG